MSSLYRSRAEPCSVARGSDRERTARASCDAASFARLGLPATRIVSAAAVSDDPRGSAHCVLRGAVNERTGTDGRPYAIGFEMRLPDNWNGRYFDQLNGGNDGAIVPAYGNLGGNQPDNALARGYATLSSDSGHDGPANPGAGLVGGNLFGFDAQARLDYGYAANVTLTPIAKTIIERYYGRHPEYSYMVGCSNGGRHAFVGATRLADEFDGFLAGAPGYNLPMVALQHAWDVQSFDQAGGDIRRALSRDQMGLVADTVRRNAMRSTEPPTESSVRLPPANRPSIPGGCTATRTAVARASPNPRSRRS